MGRFPQPCLTCGTLTTYGNRCQQHQAIVDATHAAKRTQTKRTTNQYGGAYTRLAAIVRANATHCHLCHQPFQAGDRIQADHLNPSQPVTQLTDLAAAHDTCNRQRSNKPLNT